MPDLVARDQLVGARRIGVQNPSEIERRPDAVTLDRDHRREIVDRHREPIDHLAAQVFDRDVKCCVFGTVGLIKLILETLGDYAVPGVDVISVGALTHSATAVDLSLTIVAAGGKK